VEWYAYPQASLNICLRLRPRLHPLEQGLAPDWRGPARTVTLRAKPRAAREPAGHTAAAAADWALVISLLSIRDHAPEYKAKIRHREVRTASISQLFVSIAAPAGLGLNRRRVHRAFQLSLIPAFPSSAEPHPRVQAGFISQNGMISISGRETGAASPLVLNERRMERQAAGFGRGLRRAPDRLRCRRWGLSLCDSRGRPDFRALHAEMRQRRPDVSRMAFFAFNLPFERAVDLMDLPRSERQHDLARLCDKGRKQVPCLYLVESFPEGEPLLEWCASYGLEAIVSKKLSSPYLGGACRNWVKVKSDGWRQANQFRHKMFEGNRKPEPSPHERDLKKKREELARVLERLQDSDVRAGIARELRRHIAILEKEIAELEQAQFSVRLGLVKCGKR
jgi:hypothetical protein